MTSIPSLFRIIRNWNIRIIYASGDPFSSLVTAILLKKITKIPVILDFRDPWKDNINCTKQSLYRRKVCASLEAFCVRNSDAVLATTSKLLEALKQYSGNVIFRVIQNGFDDEDFVLQIKSCEKKEEFNFLYTGKYSIDSPDYNPVSLIKAFRLFREKKTIAKAKLVLIGRTDDKTINSLKSLENMGIYCHNIMPKDQLSKFLSNADCFIHFYYPNIYSDTISTKMFEYAYYLKPILSFSSNDGEIERFLTELQIGSCTSSHNEDKMANLLLKAYENQIVVNMKFAEKNIHKYHFRNRTSELADLIKTIVT
jgi:glycosyltransferase involved in cell wall biosynthesis